MPETSQADSQQNKESEIEKGVHGDDSPLQISTVRLPSGLRWILILGGLLLVGLLAASIFVPNMAERIKFFTVNALSLLVLLAIVVQVYISRRQWETMERQGDAMQGQLVAMKIQAAASEAQMEIAALSVEVSERSAKAAERSVKLAQEAFYVGERAYVEIKEIKLLPLKVGAKPEGVISLLNAGRTPASNAYFLADMAIGGNKPPTDRTPTKSAKDVQESVIPAGATKQSETTFDLIVTADDLWLIHRGRRMIYIYGIVSYTDIQGELHVSPFCAVWDAFRNNFKDCKAEENGKATEEK